MGKAGIWRVERRKKPVFFSPTRPPTARVQPPPHRARPARPARKVFLPPFRLVPSEVLALPGKSKRPR